MKTHLCPAPVYSLKYKYETEKKDHLCFASVGHIRHITTVTVDGIGHLEDIGYSLTVFKNLTLWYLHCFCENIFASMKTVIPEEGLKIVLKN